MEITRRISFCCFKEPVMKDVGLAYLLRCLFGKGEGGQMGVGWD